VTDKLGLSPKNLVAICTGGFPGICGRNIGRVTFVEEFCGKQVTKHHCIIHQQFLCSLCSFELGLSKATGSLL
jgi:hypothetical protein